MTEEAVTDDRQGEKGHRPWIKYYPKGVPSVFIPRRVSIYRAFEDSARQTMRATALNYFGTKMSYGDLARKAERMSRFLLAAGIRKGDRVAVMLPNCPEAVITILGCLRMGAVVTMVNPTLVASEIDRQLKDSGAALMVFLDLFADEVCRAETLGNTVKRVVICRIDEYMPGHIAIAYRLKRLRVGQKSFLPWRWSHRILQRKGVILHAFRELVQQKKTQDTSEAHSTCVEPFEIQPESDLAFVQYTSGTTGEPKGVMLTHHNVIANVDQIMHMIRNTQMLSPVTRILTVVPFFHVFGLIVILVSGLTNGAELVLLPKFDPVLALRTIHREKPDIFPATPTMYEAMMRHPRFGKYDVSSLKFGVSGGARLSDATSSGYSDRTGSQMFQGYGLTEACSATHMNPLEYPRPGTIGVPLPGTDAKLVDAGLGNLGNQGMEEWVDPGLESVPMAGEGGVGELMIRGPQVMKGYWNMPDETAEVMKDGWLYTGDLATVDQDGYFRIVGRKKDIIISGGYNICPAEIETVLSAYPGVSEVAVVGIPDVTWGEVVAAVIVLKDGTKRPEPERVIDYCRGRLAKYKLPRKIYFLDELPRGYTGKLLRRRIVEMIKDGHCKK